MDVDEAARVDPAPDPQAAVDARGRQRAQHRRLLAEAPPAPGVPGRHHAPQERDVLPAVGEVAAAPHQQGLVHRRLQVPVGRLVVAVLVGAPHVDPLAGQAVVPEQVLVAGVELPLDREVVDGRRQAVGAVPGRHPAEFPQGVLQAVAEGLEGLRGADGDRLPVGVARHEVVRQVVERLPLDGHPRGGHGGEVGGREVTGVVDLPELHVLRGAASGLPLPDPALEGTPVGVVEEAGVLGLHPVEEGLGHQPGLGREALLDGGPDAGERVGAGAVGARRLGGAGECAAGAVPACRLVVHVRPPGGGGEGRSAVQFAEQLAHLGIRNHRTPPDRGQGLAWQLDEPGGTGWGQPGVLVVAGREK